MYLNVLFVLFVVLVYAERVLTRFLGRIVSTILLAISGIGMCCVVAVYIAEAM